MKIRFIIIGIVSLSFMSCQDNSEKAIEIVDKVLTQINDKIEGNLDTTVFEPEYFDLFKTSFIYFTNDWELKLKQQNDSIFIVESNGKTHNAFGMELKNHQEFKLAKRDGKLQIIDTYNLIGLFLNMKVVDKEWDFYWDKQKEDIVKDLEGKLELEVVTKGHKKYSSSVVGDLKLINNSDYDISNVEILIEHFDSDGKSVNTDTEYLSEVIRANGYREFDWYTSDCKSCSKQQFSIKFKREQ